MKHFFLVFGTFAISLLLASCSSSVYKEVYPTLIDGQYDSEFPYKGCSQQLEEVSQTVRRITVMTTYKSYTFSLSDSIRPADVTPDLLNRLEPQAVFQHLSTAGSATVISYEGNNAALITCAHIVNFSDTVIARYVGSDYRITPFLRSIALKTNQLTFLNEVAGGIALDIVAMDTKSDLAILGAKLDANKSILLKVFKYPLGNAKELEWGSFVYLFGYPAGYRMVTKGIVSPSSRPPAGSFIVDAVLSPGSSGSIALAIRDGVPNFELVGIIKMIPAHTSYILTPGTDGDVEYDPTEPYRGEVFVQRKAEIQQGIAVAIPTETIVAFIDKYRTTLLQRGYDLQQWAHPQVKPQKK